VQLNITAAARLFLVAAAAFAAVVGVLGLAEGGAELPRCNLGDVECLFASHETLAAGLLGAAGTIFAGWLAYSAAQQATARALAEARAAKRAALAEQIAVLSSGIDRLKLAKGYLETFTADFPPTHPDASRGGFVSKLRQCHAHARDFLSSTAIRAPFGYGSQILTVMTRIEKLGDRIEQSIDRNPGLSPDSVWGDIVFEAIAGLRSLAAQITSDIPVHERSLVRLADQRDDDSG
jgi:hypothetical protein